MLPASAPAPAGDEQAVIAEAERIVREEQDREVRRERRKARGREKQGLARGERERKAVEQAGRDEQLRRAAGRQRQAMPGRIRERGAACGGRIMEKVFAAVPGPRDPRGVRHPLACVLALVMMAMLCDNETLVSITCWISAADQGLLAAAGARALPDGTRQAPCPGTVARVLGAADPDAVDDAVCRHLADGERALQAAGDGGGQQEEEEEEEEAPGLMPQAACDGKYVKGARRPDGTSLILLSAATPAVCPSPGPRSPRRRRKSRKSGPCRGN
jgi:hypothetical protein